jgi:nitrogen fixation NifU-like protein
MAEANLTALYQDLILDHYHRPRNKGVLERADTVVTMKNPLCGDEIELQLEFDGTTIRDVKFTGQGCSISQASTSMMTDLVKGKDEVEIEQLRKAFRAMVMGDSKAEADVTLGKMRALSGVSKFPARVKCALLGWNALEEGVDRHRENTDDV